MHTSNAWTPLNPTIAVGRVPFTPLSQPLLLSFLSPYSLFTLHPIQWQGFFQAVGDDSSDESDTDGSDSDGSNADGSPSTHTASESGEPVAAGVWEPDPSVTG